MRVLVLDDDSAFQNMLRAALGEAGYEVAGASDGAAGLELAQAWMPDVILLDVLMPGMDGRSFARRYANLPGPRAPIVVLTGLRDGGPPIANAVAWVTKPFELDELIGLVGKVASPA